MARTESRMLALGTKAPDFHLPNAVTGTEVSLESFAGKRGLLVIFMCRHCPFVKHVEDEIARIGRDYANTELGIVAISSNDAVEFPDDRPESLREMAEELGFGFPFCYDESQQVAKDYDAACTPDFYVFDSEQRLAYRGQLDGSRPGNDVPVTGVDLRAAIDAVLDGRSISTEQRPSLGCNIKWKAGNAPEWFGV